jgi:hypothetical protein
MQVGPNYTTVTLKRGELLFGRKSAARELGVHESKIYRMLKKFQSFTIINVKSNTHYSIVSICNYEHYTQDFWVTEQPSNNHRTTIEQPSNTSEKNKETKETKSVGTHRHNGFLSGGKEPTIDLCIDVARKNNISESKARHYFHIRNAGGWKKGSGQKVVNIESDMLALDKDGKLDNADNGLNTSHYQFI